MSNIVIGQSRKIESAIKFLRFIFITTFFAIIVAKQSTKNALLLLAVVTVSLCAFLYIFYFSSRVKQRTKYLVLLLLVLILPFQNSLNLLVGFSLRPFTLGMPFFLFTDSIANLVTKHKIPEYKLYFVEQTMLLLVLVAIIFLPLSFLSGSILGGLYGFITQFQGIFIYFVVRNLILTKQQIKKLLLIMFFSLMVMVGYGFYEFMWGQYQLIDWLVAHSHHPFVHNTTNLMNGFYRAQQSGEGFYRSQSFELEFVSFGYSGYILSVVLLSVIALTRSIRKRKIMWIALLWAVLGLLSSVTLSAVAIFVLSFGIIGLETLYHRGRAKYFWSMLPLVALIGIIVVTLLFPTTLNPIYHRLENLSVIDRYQVHATGNSGMFESVLGYIIIGRGTGTSGPGSRKFFPADYFVENEYLGNIAEWGIVGLLVYLLFLFALFRHILKFKRRYRFGTLGYAVGVGLLCIAIGYVLIGFSHNVWGQSSIDIQYMMLLSLWTTNGDFFRSI